MIEQGRIDEYVWRSKKEHPKRFGDPCRIVHHSVSSLQITVEFPDGLTVQASRMAVRRMRPREC